MNKSLTQLEFTDADFAAAKEIARRKWRDPESGVYTSQSEVIGLEFPKRNNKDTAFTIIKTKELGFLIISDLLDNNIYLEKEHDWGN